MKYLKTLRGVTGIILCVIFLGLLLTVISDYKSNMEQPKVRIGVIFNGEMMDKSWGQSHYNGLEKCAEDNNYEILYRQNVPEDKTSSGVMEELIDAGCSIIICDSIGYDKYIKKTAREHPEIYFFNAGGEGYEKNETSVFGRIYQMRYLSGIVAGLQTQTNEIGYVAAMPISEVVRGINAFTLGVRSVNPKAYVYVEWSSSWTDDKMTGKSTTKLLDEHNIDVITMHTNSLAVLDIAEENGIYSIGYNFDNSKDYPATYLTAPIWDWSGFYSDKIKKCIQGKFISGSYWEGAESGIVKLAPLTSNVKTTVKDIVDEQMKMLQNSEFDVFYGPIYDNEGVLRVEQGENLSDETMLNNFDWYVEGAVVDEYDEEK